jgi:hypothetical protein
MDQTEITRDDLHRSQRMLNTHEVLLQIPCCRHGGFIQGSLARLGIVQQLCAMNSDHVFAYLPVSHLNRKILICEIPHRIA